MKGVVAHRPEQVDNHLALVHEAAVPGQQQRRDVDQHHEAVGAQQILERGQHHLPAVLLAMPLHFVGQPRICVPHLSRERRELALVIQAAPA